MGTKKKWAARVLIVALVAAAFWLVGFHMFGQTPSEATTPAGTATAANDPAGRTTATIPMPEVCLEVVNPESVAWIVKNCGSVVLRQPRVTPVLVNIDKAHRPDGGYDLLKAPTRLFGKDDWIKPGGGLGPYGIESIPSVKAELEPGNRVAGYIRVDCPDCEGAGRSYWVFWVVGRGGWYSEVPNGRNIFTNALARVIPALVSSPESFFSDIPISSRRPIVLY